MISITTQTASEYSLKFKEIKDGTDVESRSRRVSRVSTLDGESVVVDSGYTDTDRDLVIKAKLSIEDSLKLKYMFENFTLFTVVTNDGCYSCVAKKIKPKNGLVVMKFLVAE